MFKDSEEGVVVWYTSAKDEADQEAENRSEEDRERWVMRIVLMIFVTVVVLGFVIYSIARIQSITSS